VSWLKKSNPEAEREAQLLRQWRRSRREVDLQLLPLRFMLRSQCRSLEETEEAENERMGLLPVHRKLLRLIKRRIGSASKTCVSKPLKWLSRLPCLQPTLLAARRGLVQCRRRLALKCLALMLRGLRLSLGSRKSSKSSPTN
jgi:hypothetical protein